MSAADPLIARCRTLAARHGRRAVAVIRYERARIAAGATREINAIALRQLETALLFALRAASLRADARASGPGVAS